MENGVTRRVTRGLRLMCCVSVYLSASTGDTFPAIRPGREQESSTVTSENAAEPRNIHGEILMEVYTALKVELARVMGTAAAPTP